MSNNNIINNNNNNNNTIPTPTPTPTLNQTYNNNNNNNNNEDDLIISYYLLKKCKLWVWDFDDTLIDTNYYYKTSMEPNDILKRTDEELTNEVPHWKYFKRLVEYLAKHGKYIAIASFGTYEIIKAYMDRIMGFNQTFFNKKNLIAPVYNERQCRSFKLPANKNEYIYKIMKHYTIEDFKSVVLFDDLPSNIADAVGIGIIGIQIATPSNGDKLDNHNIYGTNMYFNPMIMIAFDKKIENDCGKELYLNRTYSGVTNKYNSKDKSSFTGMSYDKIDFRNGIKEDFEPVAFGTGIGNRKISTNPEYRWNKMNVSNPPEWVNGNWVDSTLGGESVSFWDKYHSVHSVHNVNKNKSGEFGDGGESGDGGKSVDGGESGDGGSGEYIVDNDDKYYYENIKKINVNPYNGKLNEPPNYVMGVTEGFKNSKCGFDNMSKNEWNRTILILIVVILLMILLIYNVV